MYLLLVTPTVGQKLELEGVLFSHGRTTTMVLNTFSAAMQQGSLNLVGSAPGRGIVNPHTGQKNFVRAPKLEQGP
jgi:hypothetical protein